MASNRFRYPPAPGHGGDTFSDNLVGNQITDGSSQMTLGNFSIDQDYSQTIATPSVIRAFSKPITLESLDFTNLETAQELNKSNFKIFLNSDTSDINELVLYGSLNKRLSVATQNIINFFPGSIFVDGVNPENISGNTTAYNISYDIGTDITTFDVSVDAVSNPFSIEFTTNGELLTTNLTKQQILNNLEMFGYGSDTIIKVADGTVSKLRNLTLEYKNYVITFGGTLGQHQYKLITFIPQNTNTTTITLGVQGNPFNNATTSIQTFFIKPNNLESQKAFDAFDSVESFLTNRDVYPPYTATFKFIKENSDGSTYYSYQKETWPKQDAVNLDVSSSAYTTYITSLSELGEELDKQKTNLVSRFLTAPVLKEFDTSDQKVEKTLQIYGRSFDNIKTFIEGIAYMTNVTYDTKNNIPNKLIKNFARTLGWSTPNTLNKTNFLDNILGVTEPLYSGTTISKTPAELDIELYRRILLNTAYLFKSKGCRKSIEFLLGLVGAPPALVEFNEYVVLADSKVNLNRFNQTWEAISGGSYTTRTIKYSIPFSSYTYSTGTTIHPFTLRDYPVDSEGYPTTPYITNNYFFQRGAGWFERTEEHKSELITNEQKSILSGCTPNIVTEFAPFTWGGFWTVGQYSNVPKAPYLDRFRRFPHMPFGFHLERIIDDKKSWVEIGGGNIPELLYDNAPLYGEMGGIPNLPAGFRPVFKDEVAKDDCDALRDRRQRLLNKFIELSAAGTNPNWRKLLINRIEYIEKIQKRRDCPKELDTREYSFKNRSSYYQTTDERLVLNVKNIDLALNIGQGLTYDVWRQSSLYDCMFSGGTLPPPYPSSGGTWDSTNPRINAKKLNFKAFHKHFWKVFIDTKNRMTINDGKTGGYPTLQQMYLDYLKKNCGANNQYTYQKMIDYAQAMGDSWIRLIEQMVPTTTLWTSGLKINNSVFHRDKFVYRCFSMSGSSWDSGYTTTFTVNPTGYTSYPAPQFQARMMNISAPPPVPASNTLYYRNIISGNSINPTSSYANSYDIDNPNLIFGNEIVVEVVKKLANGYHSNKKIFRTEPLFTKQGSTHNLLCIDGLRYMGTRGYEWVDSYDLNNTNDSPGPQQPTRRPITPNRGGGTQYSTRTTSGSGGMVNRGGY